MKEIIYTCNNILLSLNTEGHFDICYSMDEHEDIMICEISQSQKDSIVLFHLHELLRVVSHLARGYKGLGEGAVRNCWLMGREL